MYQKLSLSILLLIMGFSLAACGGAGNNEPKPDTQATIDAAIAATATTQADIDAQVEAAVEATVTAMPTVDDPADYGELSEEELALLIEGHVDDTMVAAEDLNTYTAETTSDGEITLEEAEDIDVYIADLEDAITETEELIYLYNDVYGELATETLYLLSEVEDDLQELAEVAVVMVELLIEVEEALAGGAEVAVEVIQQLDAAVVTVQEKLPELQAKRDAWMTGHQTEIETLILEFQNLVPAEVAGNRREALLSAFDYVDAVRSGLEDRQLNLTELRNIAQLGANAQAGLDQYGGPKLNDVSGNIGNITNQLARGQNSLALGGLGQLEGALGARP
jgi:hypothetical protein